MINRIVSFALAQRFIVIVAMLCLAVWGVVSFQNLPIDAYPDLSPPRVQIVTQWPGHAAEEVERLITIPLEVEMNGIPKLDALRSISLYGLSSITMNFQYDTDPYFAREQAFERIPDAAGAGRRDARHVAALQPERPDLPLRAAEPGPVGAGAEDPRGLGARAALPRDPGRRRRLQPRRRDDAVPGAARSAPADVATASPCRRSSQQLVEQQRQRRRRLLLAGRAVLLRARPRPGEVARGHRQHRDRRARRASR